MPHEISIIKTADGREIEEAFYAGNGTSLNPAWHGLGQNTLDAKTSQEAISLAHLLWEVQVVPAAALYNGEYHVSDEFAMTIRDDTKRPLGQVSPRYAPVQNWEAFDFLDSLVGNGELFYESAGALHGGKRVWLLARLPGLDQVAEGDITKKYLLFVNYHDGSGAIRCLPTTVRVVCQNTLSLALGRDGSEGIKIRHIGDIRKKVDAARKVLSKMSDVFRRVMEIQAALAKRKIESKEFVSYVDALYPHPVDENGNRIEDGRAVAIRNNIVSEVSSLYYRDPCQNIPSIQRTAYAALNAVTHRIDHFGRVRVTKQNSENEARMNSVVFGAAAETKRQAFQVAQDMFLGEHWDASKEKVEV